MKKLLLIMGILFVGALSACDEPPVEVNCAPGFEEVDGACQEIEVVCESDQTLINGVCVDEDQINDPDLEGPAYSSQGYEDYEGRDIVSDSCEHLDNIGEWQPVWCDEFNYTGLPNSSLWSYDVGGSGWGNGEAQYYTDGDLDNAFVQDGYLTIKSIKESYGGNAYTSARLVSKNKGDFLYGKIQVRAKVPAGTGTWPAIWMLPTDWEYGGWPVSGEIDIMEYVGYDPNIIHATIHTGAFNHSIGTQIGKARGLATVEEEFHVYEIEWEPNVIRYYLNGVQFFEVAYNPDTMSHVLPYEAWPFDKDFHLLLNTAIGGAWGGVEGIDDSIFPTEFQIDYVRVYQKDYAGMDSEAPSAVTNMRLLDVDQASAFVAWDVALDDVLTKEYEVYQDGVLLGLSSHNGYLLEGLSPNTSYEISVIPLDFAGNKGAASDITITTESPLTVNDRIEAEDYVTMSGVDVEETSDSSGGSNVGWIDTNDYMTYTIEVEESGNYVLDVRAASPSGSAGLELYANDQLLVTLGIGATGDWQNWSTFTSTSFYLEAGTYTFKVVAIGSGFNLNYYEFK
jgi:beta-glucanase (GH16 family)